MICCDPMSVWPATQLTTNVIEEPLILPPALLSVKTNIKSSKMYDNIYIQAKLRSPSVRR